MFETKICTFTRVDEKNNTGINFERHVSICSNIDGLVIRVIPEGNIEEENKMIRIGLDRGGGFMKPFYVRLDRGGGFMKPFYVRLDRGGGFMKPFYVRLDRGGGFMKPFYVRLDRGGGFMKPFYVRLDRGGGFHEAFLCSS